jgi:hypothetical protein
MHIERSLLNHAFVIMSTQCRRAIPLRTNTHCSIRSTQGDTLMWIIIAGTVIASIITSALLLSSLSVGKRGDDWSEAAVVRAAQKKNNRFGKPATQAGPR